MLGLVVLIFAAGVLMIALRRPLDLAAVRIILWLDVAWVVASPIVLIVNPFSLTSAGQWAVGSVALIVLDIAILRQELPVDYVPHQTKKYIQNNLLTKLQYLVQDVQFHPLTSNYFEV